MYMSFSALRSRVLAHRFTYVSCFPDWVDARKGWKDESSMNSVCSTTWGVEGGGG